MVGELYGTFCERSIGHALKAFELWAYPDSTLNLVAVTDGPTGKQEACFPCAIHHLQHALDGRALKLSNEDATLRLQKREEMVSVEASSDGHQWRQCIDANALQDALDRVVYSRPLR